jgi:hypothetical protein
MNWNVSRYNNMLTCYNKQVVLKKNDEGLMSESNTRQRRQENKKWRIDQKNAHTKITFELIRYV